MNVGFLTTEYPGWTPTGGIGTSIRNLACALLRLGVKVTVYLIADCKDGRENHGGIVIRTIQTCSGVPLSGLLTRMKAALIINNDYIAGRLDILEAPDWGGVTAMMPILCPVVVRCHGSDTYFCELDNRPVRTKNYFLEMVTLRSASAVISVSEYTARRTEMLFNMYDSEIEIIRNCVPQEFLESAAQAPHARRDSVILYIGTLIRKKGIYELPEIFNRVHAERPDVRLFIAGSDAPDNLTGSTWQSVQAMFTPTAIQRVKYLGSVPYERVIDLLLNAAVCVFPSYAEAFPLSWLEAMSARCPVVASNIGWAGEMIQDGITGYLVNPNNHGQYARRILQLLDNAKEAESIGNRAHENVVINYSGSIVARNSLDMYRTLL